jgi:hypothetical protein
MFRARLLLARFFRIATFALFFVDRAAADSKNLVENTPGEDRLKQSE